MELSSLAQMLALDPTRLTKARPGGGSDPTTSAALPTEGTVSLAASMEVELALHLRVRIQLDGNPAEAPISQPARPEEEEQPTRRALRRETRAFLRGLDRSVRRQLKAFLKATDGLDDDSRDAIKDLAKAFRRDLKQAFRAGFGDGRTELDAVADGVQSAFANLMEGLQRVAAETEFEDDDVSLVRAPGLARRFLAGLDRAVRGRIRLAIRRGGFDASQVEKLRDLARDFHRDLRTTFQESRDDDEVSTRDFLRGLKSALDRLSSGLEAFLAPTEPDVTPDVVPDAPTDPGPKLQPDAPASYAAYA